MFRIVLRYGYNIIDMCSTDWTSSTGDVCNIRNPARLLHVRTICLSLAAPVLAATKIADVGRLITVGVTLAGLHWPHELVWIQSFPNFSNSRLSLIQMCNNPQVFSDKRFFSSFLIPFLVPFLLWYQPLVFVVCIKVRKVRKKGITIETLEKSLVLEQSCVITTI